MLPRAFISDTQISQCGNRPEMCNQTGRRMGMLTILRNLRNMLGHRAQTPGRMGRAAVAIRYLLTQEPGWEALGHVRTL